MKKMSLFKILLCFQFLITFTLLAESSDLTTNAERNRVLDLINKPTKGNKPFCKPRCIKGPTGPAGPCCPGATGATGVTGFIGATGATGVCSSCNSGCLVGQVTAFFSTENTNQCVGPTGVFGPTGPIDQSITATAWDIASGNQFDLFNKDQGAFAEQGLGICGAETGNPTNEIDDSNFIQLDLNHLLALNPVPDFIELTIESIQLNEGFSIYQGNTNGILGTLTTSFINTTGVADEIKTISIPFSDSSPRYLQITATPPLPGGVSDVLLDAVIIPQCEAISSPLILVIDPSIGSTGTVTGNFIGQLAFFQNASIKGLYVWDGTAWFIPT